MTTTATAPRIANGLDLAALDQVVEAIGGDPAVGVVGFRVSTEWGGQTRSSSTVESYTIGGNEVPRSFTIDADEPVELLGTNGAPNPQELLMSAVNACMMVGYVAGASLKGIDLEAVEIRTRGTLDLRGFLGLDDQVAPGYEAIDYEVRIKGNGSIEQFEEIHQTVMKTSPNYFNISRPIRMNGTLKVG